MLSIGKLVSGALAEALSCRVAKFPYSFGRVVNQQSGDRILPLVGLDDHPPRLGGLVFVLGPSGS
jgi:hypothetical protein